MIWTTIIKDWLISKLTIKISEGALTFTSDYEFSPLERSMLIDHDQHNKLMTWYTQAQDKS